MTYYVWGPTSYRDYLHNISTGVQDTRKTVTIEMTRQTREIIATREALEQNNLHLLEASSERITTTLDEGFEGLSYQLDTVSADLQELNATFHEGFERLSYQLDTVSAGLHELNATFHWGFSAILAELGHMRDTLSELVKIAKTPVQTVAYNHFEIARDAFRQGLYQECREELDKAINGDHTSSGYKLEWRFHHLMGTLQLGFAEGDLTLLDLPQAEASFLMAARYAKTDYPQDAGRAFLAAGWTAYCQGKLPEALTHTKQAIALYPELAEAHFQAAKVHMARGESALALSILEKTLKMDSRYALKAAGDGDFQKYEDQLRTFLEDFRLREYRQQASQVREALEQIKRRRAAQQLQFPELARSNADIDDVEARLAKGAQLPLFDLPTLIREIRASIENINRDDFRLEEHYQQASQVREALEQIKRRRAAQQLQFPELARSNADIDAVEARLAKGVQLPLFDLPAMMQEIRATIETINKRDDKTLSELIDKKNESLRELKKQLNPTTSDKSNNKASALGFLITCVVEAVVLLIVFAEYDWEPRQIGPTKVWQITHSGGVNLNGVYYGSREKLKFLSENKDSICIQAKYGKQECYDKKWSLNNGRIDTGYYVDHSSVIGFFGQLFWLIIFPATVLVLSIFIISQTEKEKTNTRIHVIEAEIETLSKNRRSINYS